MRNYVYATALSLPALFAAETAHACPALSALDVHDIKYASVVVVGRVSNYEIVLDQAARRSRQEWLANSPNMSPDQRKLLSEQKVYGSDYARFQVRVDEVLLGRPPKILSVTWHNSTFREPDRLGYGPLLIGLRGPGSKWPDPKSLTVLQPTCSSPFIFESTSRSAKAVREILSKAPE